MMKAKMILEPSVFSIHLTDITSLMMKIEMVLETSVSFIHLTRLIAREDFIEFCRRESFRSDKKGLTALCTSLVLCNEGSTI
jgi:hypothetical protein